MKKFNLGAMPVLAFLCASAALWGQTTEAVLVGIITDPSGAAIAGANVTAVNAAIGVSRDVVTNETGAYRIGPLTPGTYEVRFCSSGTPEHGRNVRQGRAIAKRVWSARMRKPLAPLQADPAMPGHGPEARFKVMVSAAGS